MSFITKKVENKKNTNMSSQTTVTFPTALTSSNLLVSLVTELRLGTESFIFSLADWSICCPSDVSERG